MNDTTIDQVERLTRRRARVATVMGIMFIAIQLSRTPGEGHLRSVEVVALGGWALWALILILFILFGGGLLRGPAVRALLNDENTNANRRTSLVAGFWAMLIAAAAIYLVTFFGDVAIREALHIIITTGVAVAMIWFGWLERRALGE
jgi:hypothetical protein